MATEIQEPNDLPEGSITDATANKYEILVYEKASDNAGIKKIGIAPWKSYLGFNSHKVNNVASYVGMPDGYDWDSDADVPYTGTTVTNQIDTLATKLGISQEPGTFSPPLLDRVTTNQNDIDSLKTTVTTPTTGLVDRVTAIENEIGGATPGDTSITSRLSELETKVGDTDSGLVKDVDTLETQVQDVNTGLLKRTTDIEEMLNGSTPGTGLVDDVNALQTTVGDSSSGLVKEVADNTTDISNINDILGDGTTDGLRKTVSDLNTTVNDPNDGLVKRVDNLESEVFRFSGSITAVDDPDDTTAITVNGSSISLSALKNGQVFDINPAGVVPDAKIKMTINGVSKEYSRGQNVVWVEPESGLPYFDELAANIDVEEVNKIAARYGNRTVAANTSFDISTWSLPSGVYQFTLCATSGMLRNVSIVIVPILSGAVAIVDETGVVKITPDNFATYWEFTAGSLFVKSSAGLKSLTFSKIGEI